MKNDISTKGQGHDETEIVSLSLLCQILGWEVQTPDPKIIKNANGLDQISSTSGVLVQALAVNQLEDFNFNIFITSDTREGLELKLSELEKSIEEDALLFMSSDNLLPLKGVVTVFNPEFTPFKL